MPLVELANALLTICEEEGIDADFARVPGYLVAAISSHQSELVREFDACLKLDVNVEWSDHAPVVATYDG